MPTSPPVTDRPAQAWSSWYLTLPKIALALLLVLLVALLWLWRQNEVEEQRSTLIADALWLEQNVRFHLDGNAEALQQLALDLALDGDPQPLFRTRSRHLLRIAPALRQIRWIDAEGRSVDALPRDAAGSASAAASERAGKLARPVYSEVFVQDGEYRFELHLPLGNGVAQGAGARKAGGELVAIYSLDALLKQQTPWWLAEKYLVRVVDGNGKVLASKSQLAAGDTAPRLADDPQLSYRLAFDPPGDGLHFQLDAHRAAGSVAQTWLATLILILAAAVLASLWLVRVLIQRRLAAEQALRSAHAFRKAMEDSLTVGMRARDLDGRITYVNPAFCRMFGFAAEELVGRAPPMPYWDAEHREKTEAIHSDVLAGRAPREGFELRYRRKSGETFDALVYEAPLIDADGRHTGWMSSILDVTARKRAEETARQQEEKLQLTSRLVAMGEMASTLAHELNQPLAAIASYNAGCLNKLDSGSFDAAELREALAKLGVQAQRAGQIIRRVHDFVRKRTPQLAPCDLAPAVEESIAFIEPLARKHGIVILREIERAGPPAIADSVMIGQVLLNLMRNAIEAMAGMPAERRVLLVRLVRQDRQWQLSVSDRGPGIPAEIRQQLFTPLLSTKPEGMGMGLNICRSIVELHHGRLWLEANPAGGCVFVITLPITGEERP